VTETPRQPRTRAGPVRYRGADLEAERGPGLGCFRFQLVVLAIFIVLTPISVSLNWPIEISSALLILTLVLLLFVGQTVIFLLRLVAAERRGRRRPLASRTPTVGELEESLGTTPHDSGPDDLEPVAIAAADGPKGDDHATPPR
jgi:hypothetical protein